jgi:hypothetical protein
MEVAATSLTPNHWDKLPSEAQHLIRDLQAQVLALQTENATRRTRTGLPAGVSHRLYGPRFTSVVALLSSRYRLSRREAQLNVCGKDYRRIN